MPDTRSPDLVALLGDQCRRLRGDPAEADVLQFSQAAAQLIEGWA